MSLVCGQKINPWINRDGDFLGYEYLVQSKANVFNQSSTSSEYLRLDREIKIGDYQGRDLFKLIPRAEFFTQWINVTDTFNATLPAPSIFLGPSLKEGTHEVSFYNGKIDYKTTYTAVRIENQGFSNVLNGEIVTQSYNGNDTCL